MLIKKESWGEYNNHPAQLFSISDPKSGFEVQISDFGATVVKVLVPDRNGVIENVTFCQDSPKALVKEGGYLGATIGRVANRIGHGKFEIEGKKYTLFLNNGPHSLHGGQEGFNYKFWDCISSEVNDGEAVIVFEYISPDDEEGYPGNLTTRVKYNISPMKIEWIFEATTDKATIINITNHAYWNLDGLSGLIDDLEIKLNADKYMIGDETLIPTGEIKDVTNTGFNFLESIKFSEIFKIEEEIDHNFILNNYNKEDMDTRLVAELFSPKTGRLMKVFTTEPCIQVYTGNFMGDLKSFGKQCKKHSAVCLETQKAPNAINFPEFADSVILKPDMKYFHKTTHEFSIR
ncbi:MAG: galactose mutarotase [archaeon]|nr:galactose mutarotase [archaeon]